MTSNETKTYSSWLPRNYMKMKRDQIGKTVEEVTDIIGISKDYYTQIENGIRGKKLSVMLLIKIANALDMNVCEALQKETEFITEREKITENKIEALNDD